MSSNSSTTATSTAASEAEFLEHAKSAQAALSNFIRNTDSDNADLISLVLNKVIKETVSRVLATVFSIANHCSSFTSTTLPASSTILSFKRLSRPFAKPSTNFTLAGHPSAFRRTLVESWAFTLAFSIRSSPHLLAIPEVTSLFQLLSKVLSLLIVISSQHRCK